MVSNLHDITDRKLADEALREAHERFHSAFEHAPIGMVMADLDGVMIRANPALGRILGCHADDLAGQYVEAFTHPDDREPSRLEWPDLASGEVGQLPNRKALPPCRRSRCWASLNVSCVRDQRGKAAAISSVRSRTSPRAGLYASGSPRRPSMILSPRSPTGSSSWTASRLSLRLAVREIDAGWPSCSSTSIDSNSSTTVWATT